MFTLGVNAVCRISEQLLGNSLQQVQSCVNQCSEEKVKTAPLIY